MSLSRWMLLIAALVGFGCLKVSQQNAVFLAGYAVGERMARAHTQQTEVSWIGARVTGLASPAHLAEVAKDRRLKLVAWSTLAPTGQADPAHDLTQLALIDAGQTVEHDDSSD